MSRAITGGFQPHGTQGPGALGSVERADENSVVLRPSRTQSTVKRYTSGHGQAAQAEWCATAGTTCPQAMVSRNPLDLHCACEGS